MRIRAQLKTNKIEGSIVGDGRGPPALLLRSALILVGTVDRIGFGQPNGPWGWISIAMIGARRVYCFSGKGVEDAIWQGQLDRDHVFHGSVSWIIDVSNKPGHWRGWPSGDCVFRQPDRSF